MANSTPANVASNATTKAPLPRGLALLGVRSAGRAPRALVRLASGRVVIVGVGSRIGRQKVVAIDADRIALSSGGAAQWLEIP
ncbi:hypothetical protein AYJ57_11935 [Salipiger sp. CCB-MM3]|uniref:hypothetical protein n=1 Tax=Roseobacteraceae TaxID=2854170 RepID=UPI00080AC211|nr:MULTISPECIES: hypothetical protein [Roseobacteraceae]ANT61013.1 hypothetical protein AYJ57_11935 [Salipiger sp. CCB-MM3]MCA0994231.1 amidophosphoribosyltransferase [Alloyangia pacifica]